MWNDEEVNWNDENLGNMAEEFQKLQKLRKKIAPLQKKKAGAIVTAPGLSVSNDPVLNDSLIFIFIFTF